MKKKLMSAVLALALTVCMAMPVVAAPLTDTDPHTQKVEVTADLTTGYVVSLPARIALVGNNHEFSADYDVKVSGNLGEDDYVEVKPANTFQLTDGSNEVTATVKQDVTKWSSGGKVPGAAQFGTDAKGHISAKITVDGSYKGDFAFTYQKKSVTP